MNPLQSGISTQPYHTPVNPTQPLEMPGPQAQHPHPPTLSLAGLSANTHLALAQVESHTNGHHQLMVLLAQNSIADGTVQLVSSDGAHAHYGQWVNAPSGEAVTLTVRTRLNDRAQYDITGLDLFVPSSGRLDSIVLSAPAPALISSEAHLGDSPVTSGQLPSRSSLADYSRSELMQALIEQRNPQDFPSAPRPSGASFSTQPGGASESVNRKRPSATDEQIVDHLRHSDGSLRTQKGVASSLHAIGLAASVARIATQLQNAGGVRFLPGATDEQIDTYLHREDGLLRKTREVADALRTAGLGANDHRILIRLRNAGGKRPMQIATDEELSAHLRSEDGALRTTKEVLSALHTVGLGANDRRIRAQLRDAGGGEPMPSATDEQLNAHLRNENGVLRTAKEVLSALHTAGLETNANRIKSRLQQIRGRN